jgi:hypothetical protein
VELVRLTSAGKNALDFTLAYYVGRAVAADPTGVFHIVSKDTGYDPLIKHLWSRHISAERHDSFDSLPFAGSAEHALPVPRNTPAKPKPPSKPKSQPSIMDEWETRVLEHFRKPSATRPGSEKTLVRFLITYFARKITEVEAGSLVEHLGRGGHLVIGERGAVTYHL